MTTQPLVYLDHAAATPLDGRVLAAMQPFFSEQFYNPSATYAQALEVRKALEAARSQVANWLGSRSSEVFFTAGGTEANNLAIHGVMRQFPDGNVVVSSIEHESVLAPAHQYDCREIAVGPDGRLDLDNLVAQIDDQTVLVSIMYANNEVGTVQSIREIAKRIAAIRTARPASGRPLYFHSDACQATNYLDLHVARLGVDLLTLNAGKMYGPKQAGALYVKAGLQLQPLISGGGQERGLRSGTESVAAAVGLATALDLVQMARHEESRRLQALQSQFLKTLATEMPQAIVNGSTKYRLPNNVHLTVPGRDNERLLIQLEQQAVLAAAGSACSASNEEPSHVLRAMGLSEADAQSSLRFTMGQGTTAAMIDRTMLALRQALRDL
jgi:cysteine desulfurase